MLKKLLLVFIFVSALVTLPQLATTASAQSSCDWLNAQPIYSDGYIASSIDYSYESESFCFSGSPGASVILQLDASSNIDGMLTLYNSNGAIIRYADSGYSGDDETISEVLSISGEHCVVVEGYNGSTGSFQLWFSYAESITYDPNDEDYYPSAYATPTYTTTTTTTQSSSCPNATELFDGSYNGTVDTGHILYAEVYLDAYQYNYDDLQVRLVSSNFDATLTLYDSNMILLDYSDMSGSSGSETVITTANTSGYYCIAIEPYGSSAGGAFDLYIDVY